MYGHTTCSVQVVQRAFRVLGVQGSGYSELRVLRVQGLRSSGCSEFRVFGVEGVQSLALRVEGLGFPLDDGLLFLTT